MASVVGRRSYRPRKNIRKQKEIDFEKVYKEYADLPKAEKTQFGYHVMPDMTDGAGPLYFALIQKQ